MLPNQADRVEDIHASISEKMHGLMASLSEESQLFFDIMNQKDQDG